MEFKRVSNGLFFADRGFNSNISFEECYKRRLKPMIKQRNYGFYRKLRKRALREFNLQLYKKYRGIIEGIFGGLATRRILFVKERNEKSKSKSIVAIGISHNIQTYMRVFLLLKFQYFFILRGLFLEIQNN